MRNVIRTLRRASRRAPLHAEWRAVIPADVAHVRAIAVAVGRRINARIAKVSDGTVARSRLERVRGDVAIAAGDDDGEIAARLAGVDGIG